jgi:hypothetical protein
MSWTVRQRAWTAGSFNMAIALGAKLFLKTFAKQTPFGTKFIFYCGVADEFLSQFLSLSLLTHTGRRAATSVQVVRVC